MRGVLKRYIAHSGVQYFAAASKGGKWRVYKLIPNIGVRLAMADYYNEQEVLTRLKQLAKKLCLLEAKLAS